MQTVNEQGVMAQGEAAQGEQGGVAEVKKVKKARAKKVEAQGTVNTSPECLAWKAALADTRGNHTAPVPRTLVVKPGPGMTSRADRNPKTGKSRQRVDEVLAQMDRLVAAGQPLTVANLLAKPEDKTLQNTYHAGDMSWDMVPHRKGGALWVAE